MARSEQPSRANRMTAIGNEDSPIDRRARTGLQVTGCCPSAAMLGFHATTVSMGLRAQIPLNASTISSAVGVPRSRGT